ncbi:MAG TPA: tetratricopeptide repeat protein [Phycisphaerae bacterium]|nr:tetratricopeptide repeat protein [Phycisphaerae bacterium]
MQQETPDNAQQGPPPKRRRRRRALFRLGAVGVGLLPFVLIELLCAAFDWGRPDFHDDPFVGFSSIQPLFVRSADGSRYEIARSRLAFFRPDSFAAVKPPGEFRIFCLGGSTVQGRPFAIETSFTTWLEMLLRLADPARRWEVVNCGGISYASYRLVPILEEVLRHQPDLIVLYTGHNEFLEDREYGHVRDIPAAVARPAELLARTRTFHLARSAWSRLRGVPSRPGARAVLGPETDTILDYKGGLARYHRDDAWRRGVMEHYRANLRRMVGLCRQAGVPVVLVNPVTNLRDCPPFKSQHRDGLTAGQLPRWEALCRQAGHVIGGDPFRAADLLRQAAGIDGEYAGLHYLLGRCLDRMGRPAEARAAYLRAKDLDVCPLRMLEPMHADVLAIAGQTRAPLVDARAMFEKRSKGGVLGAGLLVDHVHPSIPGHRLLAEALLEELARQGFVRPRPGWRQRGEQAAREHLDSLGDFYFAKGRERLESLRKWAAGRATLVHTEGPPPPRVPDP